MIVPLCRKTKTCINFYGQTASKDDTLQQVWANVNEVQTGLIVEQISRGQDCFYRYGGPYFAGLAYQALLGGVVKRSAGIRDGASN